jgi:hypothetical protein
MTDQDTIFDNKEPITAPVVAPVQDPVHELVGEGKKYATVEKALESITHAQAHIATVEEDNAALKAQLAEANLAITKATSLDEVLSKISASKEEPVTLAPTIDPQAITQAVLDQLQVADQAKVEQANSAAVVTKLQEKYGEKAEEVYRSMATKVGLSVAQLNALAGKSPMAVLAYFEQVKSEETKAPTGTVVTSSLDGTPLPKEIENPWSNKGGVDLWREIKKETNAKYGIET